MKKHNSPTKKLIAGTLLGVMSFGIVSLSAAPALAATASTLTYQSDSVELNELGWRRDRDRDYDRRERDRIERDRRDRERRERIERDRRDQERRDRERRDRERRERDRRDRDRRHSSSKRYSQGSMNTAAIAGAVIGAIIAKNT